MPVRVKICGITLPADALGAVDAGADALGFIFHPPSPRFIQPEAARDIIRLLPPFITRVGVFVDADASRIEQTARLAGLDALQFHGRETPEFCAGFPGFRVIKAFRMDGPAALARLREYESFPWLLDSFVPGALGGTGQTFNWDLACEAVRMGNRVLLAGGLVPDNVARAVAAVRPYAVDVASGVEASPGKKDLARMRDFIAAARSA